MHVLTGQGIPVKLPGSMDMDEKEENGAGTPDDAAKRVRRITLLKIWGPSIVIVAVGFVVAYQFMDPAPPSEITVLTGGADGAYHGFGMAYKDALASVIALNIIETAGSTQNLARLRTGEGDAAFIQGGTASPEDTVGLEALGTVYLEPLWVFYWGENEIARLSQLRGKNIAIGVDDSGTQALSVLLLEDNGVSEDNTSFVAAGGEDAIAALKQGRVDAVFLVMSASSALVRELLEEPGIRLMDFRRHLAYVGKHGFLTSVSLGEGVMDLEKNIPGRDYTLLAPAAMLVARKGLHPAVTSLLLETAQEVHANEGIFVGVGPFPGMRYVDHQFALNGDAVRYYEFGPSVLQRFLPFWAAAFIDRMKIMLLPLLTLLLPLLKLGPPIYVWRTRVKIYRWYSVLREIDQRHADGGTRKPAREDLERLDQLEKELNGISVPLSYMTEFYDLRMHIAHVRAKVERG